MEAQTTPLNTCFLTPQQALEKLWVSISDNDLKTELKAWERFYQSRAEELAHFDTGTLALFLDKLPDLILVLHTLHPEIQKGGPDDDQ